jgi:hypothetical protein
VVADRRQHRDGQLELISTAERFNRPVTQPETPFGGGIRR